MMEIGICDICERENLPLVRHHLIPKSKHGRAVIKVCKPCGKQVHALFTNLELERRYNTLEKLKRAPEMRRFLKWIRKTDKIDLRTRRRHRG